MSGLEHLAVYLGIAAILVFVGSFKGMGWFRRGLDRMANRQNGQLGNAKVIAGFGDHKEVQVFAGRRTFPLTLGIRLMSTGVSAALLVMLFRDIGADKPFIAPQGYAAHVFLGAVALSLLYLQFIWRYALILQDHELHVPRYFGPHKLYDLRKIEHMEDDGQYNLRLWFSEGGKTEIIKYVEGHGKLMQILHEHLAHNQFGIGALRA